VCVCVCVATPTAMSSVAWQKKDWSEILRDYSSGEDSDEHDSLNVLSVQKNAGRVTDLLHATVPTLDPSRAKSLPMGMNSVNVIREGLVDAMLARSRHLREYPASSSAVASEATSGAASSAVPPQEEEAGAAASRATQTGSERRVSREEDEGVVV